MMNIKTIIKSHKFLYSFILLGRKIKYYWLLQFNFKINRWMRNSGFFKCKEYQKLKEYKNKHLGDRCFIIATGPSLRIEDLEKLRYETTIGMNSVSLIEDTSWKPTYYGIQDVFVYKKLKDSIKRLSNYTTIFIPDTIAKRELVGNNIIRFPIDAMNHLIAPNEHNTKFSDDCYDVVYDGYTITYTLLQIATYMGFKEIYLLGADTGYAANGPQHFIETGIIDPNFKIAGERMIYSYNVAKDYADKHGVKIYNATRGGYLELFERVNFDSLELKAL